jgi:hypothetical protein
MASSDYVQGRSEGGTEIFLSSQRIAARKSPQLSTLRRGKTTEECFRSLPAVTAENRDRKSPGRQVAEFFDGDLVVVEKAKDAEIAGGSGGPRSRADQKPTLPESTCLQQAATSDTLTPVDRLRPIEPKLNRGQTTVWLTECPKYPKLCERKL